MPVWADRAGAAFLNATRPAAIRFGSRTLAEVGFPPQFDNNRNKPSVEPDLKKPAARDALLHHVATADVFMQNFRPGEAAHTGPGKRSSRCMIR
ncbi:MAG TPA: CoA transferase [Rhodopila sp.]|nr:CoA transferase [Rhodopila sp.]